MVLETLAVASLTIGATSTYVGVKEFLGIQRKNALDHEHTLVRLAQQSAQGRPCVKCDWSTLRHLNSNTYKESCVIISFEMPTCCNRCKTFKQGFCQRILPTAIHDAMADFQKVRVRVPVETYGVVQRAVEASALAEKGSKERATGTFVSHLTGRRVSAIDKIAEMKWFPYILDRAFTNKATVVLPGIQGRYDGYLSTSEYSDFDNCPQDIKTVRSRAETILRRLRKLKSDEYLTDVARQLLRLKKEACIEKIKELMFLADSDSIFDMELVKLVPLSTPEKVEPHAIALSSEDESCFRGAAVPPDGNKDGVLEDGSFFGQYPAAKECGEPSDDDKLAHAEQSRAHRDRQVRRLTRRADIITRKMEAQKVLTQAQQDWADEAFNATGQITRETLMQMRIGEEADLGFKVGVPKRLRRERKVAERNA